MIAQVIVDVAAKQTDRVFEYHIPELLEDSVSIGSRVVVNFGKSRKVQGFVVNIVEKSDFSGELKDLLFVVDEKPPLTKELVELSGILANQIFSYRISLLKAMLPGVMRANYRKILVPVDAEHPEVKELFDQNDHLDLADIDDVDTQAIINKLLKLDLVKIEYLVENKAKIKHQQVINKIIGNAELTENILNLPKNATSLKKLGEFLLQNEAEIAQSELAKKLNISTSVINKAIEKGWIEKKVDEIYRNPLSGLTQKEIKEITLTPDQQASLIKINESQNQHVHQTYLLEGITGSGKTEVYLRAIDQALKNDKTALMLVPEISLTPQMVKQVHQRFGNKVAVLHSGLSEGEKYDEWRRIRRNEVQVVVGARSAIFAPLENLGLIIIDEEHESSYKQDENPRYHARDVAILRAKSNDAVLILGSATPSLESRARAQKNRYQLLRLDQRANQKDLPEVKIIDLKDANFSNDQLDLSDELIDAIKAKIAKKEQVILLLNRRGFSSFMLCRDCGYVLKCPNCDISLTYHKEDQAMRCHYCGYQESVPHNCPNCGSSEIRFYGTGTEKIMEILNQVVPYAKVLRMDVDTTRRKGSYEKILTAFENHEADILLGTQMIAKGLDFENVTLVGVINADTSLSFADFRASEKTFQLLTQVSGRAGRGQKNGEVLIQTFNPDHYAIKLAQTQNYENFYQFEMQNRHQGDYPPYFFTSLISVSSKKEQNAAKTAMILKRKLIHALKKETIVLGPTPSAVSKIKEQYYYQILIKYKYEENLTQILHEIQDEAQDQKKYGVSVNIDMEPERFI